MTSVLATGPTDQRHLSQNHCNLFCCHHSAAKLCPTLGPHGLQHARLPCSSPSPRACSNLCPLSPWCHPTISSCPPLLLLPMDSKEIKPVNPKGNQLWIFIGRTDAEAEAPILWPPDAKNGLTGKDPDAGKDWRQEDKRTTEDEMVGWHHQLNGQEFEQALGVGDGQGSLACCSPWGCK